ncbi:hypothetical protein B1H18_21370 [Streptomyces tsukubensis]|uniref:Transposase IS701-like DDE domain-containing protein n=1 Tax=Streptomyces tsukubensis TaxID=83656 RepID=A0A1V4A5N6_9ACTN|nr:hypothetical protein B1H18_21370 [Streptomyces tsukubensis]
MLRPALDGAKLRHGTDQVELARSWGSPKADADGLRRALAVLPQLKAADDRLVLAVDVSDWSRSDAPPSADRLSCRVYGRGGA